MFFPLINVYENKISMMFKNIIMIELSFSLSFFTKWPLVPAVIRKNLGDEKDAMDNKGHPKGGPNRVSELSNFANMRRGKPKKQLERGMKQDITKLADVLRIKVA